MSTLGESVRVVEQKPGVKRIRVPALDASSDVPALAREVVAACKYLTERKTSKVEDVLMEMLQQALGGAGAGGALQHPEEGEIAMLQQRKGERGFEVRGADDLPADINDLDEYLEDLYDDNVATKARVAGQISKLAKRTEFLEELLSHTTLLGALTRVLREDGKRSMDLTIAVISVFFAFSGRLTQVSLHKIRSSLHKGAHGIVNPARRGKKTQDGV